MKFITTFLIAAFFCVATCSAQLTFNLSSTGNANADAGFQQAANFWSSQFNDDITVNLNLGFQSLGGQTLGQAGQNSSLFSFSNFKTSILNDATTAADISYTSSLPAGNAFSVYINRTTESPGAAAYVDNDGGANNGLVRIANANAKALGLISGTNTSQDAEITFNSDFSWDFDQSNGVSSGLQDFVGVAVHEIGHALGFTSGVDILDAAGDGDIDGSDDVGMRFNDDAFTFVSPLDFTRHSAGSITAGADIDWTADTRSKFYSIDAGTTAGGGLVGGTDHFSLGVDFGDGNQASHWRDGSLGDQVQLGILDPTAMPAGNVNLVSDLDIQALDVIGFTPFPPLASVPEPNSILAVYLFGGMFLLQRRRDSPG
jgi:hypothetical protein